MKITSMTTLGSLILAFSTTALAQDFDLGGDVRFRYENDWNSVKSSGSPRADRQRLRLRTRLFARFKASDTLDFYTRIRLADKGGQQSPHFTFADFDDNPHGEKHLLVGKAYARYKQGAFTAWAGRNSPTLWKQNEMFLDDDVTFLGAGGQYKVTTSNNANLSFNFNAMKAPVGMGSFSGNFFAGQTVYQAKKDDVSYTLAASLLHYNADPENENVAGLLSGNGSRDYTTGLAQLQVKSKMGQYPVTLGADYSYNFKNYDNSTNDFTLANKDEKSGFVLSAKLGSLSKPGDWLVGYWYAHMETLTVNNSFAQDDWVRWGNATQTRATNMKGHEFRAAYKIMKSLNVVARFYKADAITSVENGNRFRVDFNYSF